MYTTGGLVFPNILGQDVRPRQNSVAHEDLFLYEYARFLLHKRLVSEGILSPYACPFHIPMEIEQKETEKETEKRNQKIDKTTIAERLNKNVQDITLQDEKTEKVIPNTSECNANEPNNNKANTIERKTA